MERGIHNAHTLTLGFCFHIGWEAGLANPILWMILFKLHIPPPQIMVHAPPLPQIMVHF